MCSRSKMLTCAVLCAIIVMKLLEMLFSRRKWSLLSCEDASSIQFVPSRLLRLEVRHLYYMDIGICCFAEAVIYCRVIEV